MRDFNDAITKARARLDAEEPTAAESERVRRAVLGGRVARPRRVWIAVSCAGAVVAAMLVIFLAGRSQRVVSGFAIVEAGRNCVTSVAEGVEVTGTCEPRLAIDGAEAELATGSILVHEQSQLRLRHGRVTFAVKKRAPRQPRFVVRVSAGAVEVVGTRFTVVESGESGSVTVTEGTVEFHWADGSVAPVHAGETLVWPAVKPPPEPVIEDTPDEAADEDDVAPQPADKHGKTLPPPDPGVVMRKLLQLRTQNRFDEAIDLLRDASRNRGYSAVQRERFGFELCNLITQADSTAKACSCWRRHMRKFPDSGRSEHLPEALHDCR